MNTDVIVSYPTHNRKEYVEITAPRVIDECRRYGAFLYCGDDNSTDGTYELLESMKGFDILEQETVGNSTWQLNRAFEIAREKGAKYVYAMANDILMPEGIIETMVELMEQTNACSIMAREVQGLPFIEHLHLTQHTFTSSLGIHRVEAYPDKFQANNRFFGFQVTQNRIVKQGWKCYRALGIGNTNLDCSPWSRQKEYFEKGYARTGLVGDELSVYG